MTRTGPSRRHPPVPTGRPPAAASRPRRPLQKSELWIELTRQRALLLLSSNASLTADGGPEVCSDLADQASTDLEQDLAMQVKARTIAKLRAIDRALRLMLTSDYGRCRRCHDDIPYERLKVQADTLFCVPCLTVVEQEAATN
jgi:RNA polymerase-binding transcription factor DksA